MSDVVDVALEKWREFIVALGPVDGPLAMDLDCDPPQFIVWLRDEARHRDVVKRVE